MLSSGLRCPLSSPLAPYSSTPLITQTPPPQTTTTPTPPHPFPQGLAHEVQRRLTAAGVRGRTLTLKVKRRQAGAPEPRKFLGHGICDSLSRSVTAARCFAGAAELGSEAAALLRAMAIPADELRGLGITVTRLDNDAANAAARPSAPAPAKVAPARHTAYDASRPPAWLAQFQGLGWGLEGEEAAAAGGGGAAAAGGGARQQAGDEAAAEGGGPLATPAAGKRARDGGAGGSGSGSARKRRQTTLEAWAAASPAQQPDDGAAQGEDGDDGDDDVWEVDETAPPPPARHKPPARRPLFHPPSAPAPAGAREAPAPAPGGGGTPIAALPPASQLDPDVIDALPPALRAELEQAYGRRLGSPTKPAQTKRGAGGGTGGGAGGAPVAALFAPPAARPQKRRRADDRGAGAGARSGGGGGGGALRRPGAPPQALQPASLGHIDPEVFAALPPDVAQEVLRSLPPTMRRPMEAELRSLPPAAGAALQRRAAAAAARAAAAGGGSGGAAARQEEAPRGLPRVFWAAGGAAAGSRRQPLPLLESEPFDAVAAAAKRALAAIAAEALEAGVAEGGGGGSGEEVAIATEKLAVLAEWLAQWLVASDTDLGAVAKGLKLLRALPGLAAAAASAAADAPSAADGGGGGAAARAAALEAAVAERCAAVEAAVQAHLERKMGFTLRAP